MRIFHTIPDSISITCVRDGRYIEVNDGFLEFTGHQRSEVIGKTIADIHFLAELKIRDDFICQLRQEGILKDLELQSPY